MHRKLNRFPKIEYMFSFIWKSDSLPCSFQNENVELLTTDARSATISYLSVSSDHFGPTQTPKLLAQGS